MGLANAFAVFLYISFYVANLTSLTTNNNSAASVQAAIEYSPVTGITSYETAPYFGCISNRSGVISFLQSQFPTVRLVKPWVQALRLRASSVSQRGPHLPSPAVVLVPLVVYALAPDRPGEPHRRPQRHLSIQHHLASRRAFHKHAAQLSLGSHPLTGRLRVLHGCAGGKPCGLCAKRLPSPLTPRTRASAAGPVPLSGPADTTCLFAGMSVQGAVQPDIHHPDYAIAFSKTSPNITVDPHGFYPAALLLLLLLSRRLSACIDAAASHRQVNVIDVLNSLAGAVLASGNYTSQVHEIIRRLGGSCGRARHKEWAAPS